jgi:hypothetical protein
MEFYGAIGYIDPNTKAIMFERDSQPATSIDQAISFAIVLLKSKGFLLEENFIEIRDTPLVKELILAKINNQAIEKREFKVSGGLAGYINSSGGGGGDDGEPIGHISTDENQGSGSNKVVYVDFGGWRKVA